MCFFLFAAVPGGDDEKKEDSKSMLVVGVALAGGVLFGVIVAVVAAIFYRRKKKRRPQNSQSLVKPRPNDMWLGDNLFGTPAEHRRMDLESSLSVVTACSLEGSTSTGPFNNHYMQTYTVTTPSETPGQGNNGQPPDIYTILEKKNGALARPDVYCTLNQAYHPHESDYDVYSMYKRHGTPGNTKPQSRSDSFTTPYKQAKLQRQQQQQQQQQAKAVESALESYAIPNKQAIAEESTLESYAIPNKQVTAEESPMESYAIPNKQKVAGSSSLDHSAPSEKEPIAYSCKTGESSHDS